MNAEGGTGTGLRGAFVVKLQWGRVLVNAEGWRLDAGFKADPKLQWGRVLVNAEGCDAAGEATFWAKASMGPRPGERGRVPRTPLANAVFSLQWGRVLVNAEGTCSTSAHGPRAGFNGAASW